LDYQNIEAAGMEVLTHYEREAHAHLLEQVFLIEI
jgi:hypothetical protein